MTAHVFTIRTHAIFGSLALVLRHTRATQRAQVSRLLPSRQPAR